MNTLDMQTKEKANKIDLAEMQHDARNRHLVRDLKPTGNSTFAKRRTCLVLVVVVLILFVGTFQPL